MIETLYVIRIIIFINCAVSCALLAVAISRIKRANKCLAAALQYAVEVKKECEEEHHGD